MYFKKCLFTIITHCFLNIQLKIFFNNKVGEDNIGNTKGLCGVYDRSAENDFTTSDNKIVPHVQDFAKSWVFGGKFLLKVKCLK